MISKKTIIEKYLADLNNFVPRSPARDQRIQLLEDELELMGQQTLSWSIAPPVPKPPKDREIHISGASRHKK